MTDGLTFNVLREANRKRLPTFRNAKGELSHDDEEGSNWSLNDWCCAILGELGEASNIMKKVKRGDFTLEDCKQDLADELADVQIYLDLLANRAGIDLGKAVIHKFNEKSEQVDSPIRIFRNGSNWCTSDFYDGADNATE